MVRESFRYIRIYRKKEKQCRLKHSSFTHQQKKSIKNRVTMNRA